MKRLLSLLPLFLASMARVQNDWVFRFPLPDTNLITSSFFSVAWTGNLIIAVGDSGRIATSPDGSVWTSRTPAEDAPTALPALSIVPRDPEESDAHAVSSFLHAGRRYLSDGARIVPRPDPTRSYAHR